MSSSTQPVLVLASSSPRRQELLAGLGLEFIVHPSGADETVGGIVAPAEYVLRIARRKAENVAAHYRDRGERGQRYIILAADTTVVLNGLILNKPANEADAEEMLARLAGRTHTVFTGVCVIDASTGRMKTGCSSTEVMMRPLTREQIRRYVATGEPMDKAGAYGIQGLGATLIRRIEGDYFTVVGLPLALVTDLLEEFGIHVL